MLRDLFEEIETFMKAYILGIYNSISSYIKVSSLHRSEEELLETKSCIINNEKRDAQ